MTFRLFKQKESFLMSGSVAKIKYTDEELELEFENALKEVLEQNRLMVRSVSEGVSSFLFKITFFIALACFIIGVAWSISSLIVVVGHLSSNQTIILSETIPYCLFTVLGMAMFMLSGNTMRKLMRYAY